MKIRDNISVNWELIEKRYQEDLQSQQERFEELLQEIRQNPAKFMSIAGIPPRYHNASIENLLLPPRIINEAQNFIQGKYDGLFLSGTVGSGKTYLSVAIMKEFILQGIYSCFQSVPALFQTLRQTFNTRYSDVEEKLMNKLNSVELLTLDDLGAEKISDFTVDRLYLIIDSRYSNMKKIIITSNLTLNDIKNKIHDRLASRIGEMCKIIIMPNKDLRIEKNHLGVKI